MNPPEAIRVQAGVSNRPPNTAIKAAAVKKIAATADLTTDETANLFGDQETP
jgi:hypothetical protein